MPRGRLAFIAFIFAMLCAGLGCLAPPNLIDQAHAILRESPLIDGHNDLPWQFRQKVAGDLSNLDIRQRQAGLHTDIPRLRQGRVGGQFWSVYVPATTPPNEVVRNTLEQFDIVFKW